MLKGLSLLLSIANRLIFAINALLFNAPVRGSVFDLSKRTLFANSISATLFLATLLISLSTSALSFSASSISPNNCCLRSLKK